MSIPAPRRCHELFHASRRYYDRMRISMEALIPIHLQLLLSHIILQHLLFSVELQSAKEAEIQHLSKKVGRLSGYNTKAKEHFQYTTGGYKFEGDYKAFLIE
jgi:hypothetical protein